MPAFETDNDRAADNYEMLLKIATMINRGLVQPHLLRGPCSLLVPPGARKEKIS